MMLALTLATRAHGVLAVTVLTLVLGAALDLVSGFVTAPGAALTALTMAGSDSLTVRQAQNAKNIKLLTYWTVVQAAGASLIKSPRMHDNTQGIRALTTTQSFAPNVPLGWAQPLYSQDNLTAQLSGSTAAGKIEQMSMLLYYDALDGSTGRFITPDEVRRRGVNLMTVRTAHAFGSAGGYSGSVAINSTDDNGKQGKDYALIGYKVDTLCGAIAYHGVDTGNLRVGGPGYLANHRLTEEWFFLLSDQFGLPLVPVINWANKAGTFVDGTQNDGGAATNAQTYLVELSS